MNRKLFSLLVVLALLSPIPEPLFAAQTEGDYASGDGTLVARILAVKKVLMGKYECKVQILDRAATVLLERDYSSRTGEHGLIIEMASWSPDSEFFVYSTSSSGGHQPWQSLLFIYRRSDNTILDAQDFLPPVAHPKFGLEEPDRISLTIWSPFKPGKGIRGSIKLPITFSLKDLKK